MFLAKTGIVLGPDDDAAYAFVVAVATARLTTAARFSPRSPRARPSGPVSTAPGPRALTDLEVEPPRVTGPVASAWGAGGPVLGMQSARGRGVDRLVAVVPLDPVPRRILAQDLADRAGAGSSLRGFGLGEDPIFHLERHGSSFRLVPGRAYRCLETAARSSGVDDGARRRSVWCGKPEVLMIFARRMRLAARSTRPRFALRRRYARAAPARTPATSPAAAAAGGIALGAILAYFLDPRAGRRRRHATRDRALSRVRRGERRAVGRARRAESHAVGIARRTFNPRRFRRREPLDDVTLARKVESELSRRAGVPKGQVVVNA